jgi:hypothetical protein
VNVTDERPGSRTVLLASAVTVLASVAAGYFLWWTTSAPPQERTSATRADEAALAQVVLRPVDFAPGVTAEEREQVDRLVEETVFPEGPQGRERAGAAKDALVSHGETAVPRLLGALDRLHEEDGFEGPDTRRRAAVVDDVLRRIRRSLPPNVPPAADLITGEEPPATVLRRARAWFAWWERRSGSS